MTNLSKTLYDKIWEQHLVLEEDGEGESILFIDRHLIHEVTSPQAFASIKDKGLSVLYPERTVATTDHNVPTKLYEYEIKDEQARLQVEQLQKNCLENNITLYNLNSPHQGIVHVIAPELGYIQPGMTVVCGDSHTSTHGALGALAFGIGSTEIERVLCTQSIRTKKSKNMLVNIEGVIRSSVSPKDIILYVIKILGVDGGNGHVIEYRGSVIDVMTIEGRMTLCNMSIEAGAKAGLIAPDEKAIEYIKGKQYAPTNREWLKAVDYWKTLYSDDSSKFDKVVNISVDQLTPQVTWGTNPSQVISINDKIPMIDIQDNDFKINMNSLKYMGLSRGDSLCDLKVDIVFIGSCTNSRIEDLRAAAKVIRGKQCHKNILAIVVPGSKLVAEQANKEGLKQIFESAGFQWRNPGCSMCVGINGDIVGQGLRCVSTSNRNFEGRQGIGSRTHLVSPFVAASTAIAGYITAD